MAAQPVETVSTVETARQHVVSRALRAGPVGRVGLELEFHLVDLRRPGTRVPWQRVVAALDALPGLPAGSAVSVEPGGQVELSTPPCTGVVAAVQALRADEAALRTALTVHRLGTACLGTDPARAPGRVNPAPRYAAMEEHFAALGTRPAGLAMMCSTGALQVNVEAGPQGQWPARVRLAHRLGPVLTAISACSPMLASRRSGWHSMRAQVWAGLDRTRCGPPPDEGDPAAEWGRYALDAAVMLVRDPGSDRTEPVRDRLPFRAWAAGEVRLGSRLPDPADVDYHLSTLFPPVRLRGFLELRYLDAVPSRWWPALATVATVLLDDPLAAAAAAEACEPVADSWLSAGRCGLHDPALARAARQCLEAAAAASPPELKSDVESYAELVAAGRTPGDHLLDRISQVGPLRALEEEARD